MKMCEGFAFFASNAFVVAVPFKLLGCFVLRSALEMAKQLAKFLVILGDSEVSTKSKCDFSALRHILNSVDFSPTAMWIFRLRQCGFFVAVTPCFCKGQRQKRRVNPHFKSLFCGEIYESLTKP